MMPFRPSLLPLLLPLTNRIFLGGKALERESAPLRQSTKLSLHPMLFNYHHRDPGAFNLKLIKYCVVLGEVKASHL
jgi:hypothetical protein